MKKNEIKIGGFYRAIVSGNRVTVRVDAIRKKTDYSGSSRTVYDVTNLKTGRTTVFRSAARFERETSIGIPPDCLPQEPQTPSSLSQTLSRQAAPRGTKAPHVIVEARAGSGKTTTLVEGLKVLKGLPTRITPSPQQQAVWDAITESSDARFVCFVAFNKSIATELQNRVPPGCDAMTMHSMGFKAVRKAFPTVKVDSYRTRNLLAEILEIDLRKLRWEKAAVLAAVEKLVDLCKMNLVDGKWTGPGTLHHWEEALDELASYYDVDLNGSRLEVFDLVPKVLERAKRVDLDGCCDFADMIWLPVVLNLPIFRYDLLLVDEAQDLNRCQQALAKRAGYRLVLCGDPRQAIYGFAGADCESMRRMELELKDSPEGCLHLPLTVTRRCGKAIVKEANRWVLDFNAHEGNPEGRVSSIDCNGKGTGSELLFNWRNDVEDRNMILCRVNAPLVSECFKFLRMGRKATIQGRDIGQGLASTVNKLKATSIQDLIVKLEAWEEEQVKKENSRKNPSETRIQAIADRVDCLKCFTEECSTVEDLLKKIEMIFSDEQGEGIKLSSIHKAKGLESSRVFLLRTKDAPIPHPMARTAWAQEQETNLLYVAITRAIDELVYLV